MRTKTAGALAIFASCTFIGAAGAQDLGPQVQKLADGVYVHKGRGFESNSGIILTQDGVIVIDTGQNPYESQHLGDSPQSHLDAGASRHRHRAAC